VSSSDEHIIDLIRHGETTAGNHRLIGSSDVLLSEHGWQQLHAVVEALPMTASSLMVCTSPLLRCVQFARSFACQRNASLIVEDDFREMYFGQWEMERLHRLREDETFRRFFQSPQAHVPPAGESFEDFSQRVAKGWRRLTRRVNEGHTMVFTHGGVIRVLCCLLLSLPLSSASRVFVPHAGHMRVGIGNGRARLLSLNGFPCAV